MYGLNDFIKKCMYLVAGIFCIRCFLGREALISNFSFEIFFKYVGHVIFVSTIVVYLYEKFLWKFDPFAGIPVLKRKYKGTLISDYDGISRNCSIEIQQTFLAINVKMITDESSSQSISSSIQNINDEKILIYSYLNRTNAMVRDRSPIHYGTVIMSIDNVDKLQGQYFTDRKTTGDLKLVPMETPEEVTV